MESSSSLIFDGSNGNFEGSWNMIFGTSAGAMVKMSGMSSVSAGPVLMPTGAIRAILPKRSGVFVAISIVIQRADGTAEHIRLLKPVMVHQLKIDVRNIVYAVDPVGQGGAAEARMRRRNDAAGSGDFGEGGVGGAQAAAGMQIKKRRAAACSCTSRSHPAIETLERCNVSSRTPPLFEARRFCCQKASPPRRTCAAPK